MPLPAAPLLATLLAAPLPEDTLPPADPAVTRAALEHHVRFLASDELLGRAAGTPESLRASAYLAAVLERAGVAGAGDEGSLYQAVPLLRTRWSAAPELVLFGPDGARTALEHGPDFTVAVRGEPRDAGELAVLVVREPEDLPEAPDPGLALVVGSSRARGLRWLEERGWEGGAGFGLVIRARPERDRGRPRGVPGERLEPAWTAAADAPEVVTVDGPAAAELWEGRVARVSLALHGAREPVEERNVVGLLRGVGTPDAPALADEVLVLSAHFDHVGVARGADPTTAEEDVIRNGADDDASGTAALLELAEALAAGPPPARTVVFLFCAAEERGMWGTSWFAEHPAPAGGTLVANLNLEMLGMPDPQVGGPGRLWLTGFERSNLGPLLSERGLAVLADPRPEQRYFFRSDNIVFVRQGIVGHTLSTGGENPHYHQVTDEADTLDFEHLETCGRTALAAARLLADGALTPRWNEGEPQLSSR